MKFKLLLNSIFSPHICGDDAQKRLVWEKVGKRKYVVKDFNHLNQSDFKSGEIEISIDVTSVLKTIDHMKNSSEADLSLEFVKENGFVEIEATRIKSGSHQAIDEEVVTSFLNDLYIVMNICEEGVYDGTGIRFEEIPGTRNYYHPMEFDSNSFTDAWYASTKWGWPTLRRIDFDQAWEWFSLTELLSKPVATTPVQKAIFCLQSISEGNIRSYPSKLVEMVQTLEALMKVPGIRIASFLSERIHLILGEPNIDKKWLNKVYEVRSKIVHGSAPSIRIGYHGDESSDFADDEYGQSIERTSAVIVALIQDLIVSKSMEYDFETIVRRR